MSDTCTGRPLSWLVLERYHLGELPAPEREQTETHLGSCSACRAALEAIRSDVRRLRPLPEITSRGLPSFRRLRWISVAAAAAAAVVLVVSLLTTGPAVPPPAKKISYKGGELALTLISNRQGETRENPVTFAAGDRFKLLLTCPPPEALHWDLVVFQDGAPSFPFDPAAPVPCANRVPLPGAFRLTGTSPALVCLTVDPAPIDRADLATPGYLPTGTVCTRLEPVLPGN